MSFKSDPLESNTEFGGHFTASLNVPSSLVDSDVVITLWAVDEQGDIVLYGARGQPEPIAKGFLRASHRKTDPSRSLPERPWHTHTEQDSAPLKPGEVVALEVEILPAAAKVRKGWQLRLDVGPQEEQSDIPGYSPHAMRVWYGELHNEGVNSIHIGSGLTNYLSCPVVECKDGEPNKM